MNDGGKGIKFCSFKIKGEEKTFRERSRIPKRCIVTLNNTVVLNYAHNRSLTSSSKLVISFVSEIILLQAYFIAPLKNASSCKKNKGG